MCNLDIPAPALSKWCNIFYSSQLFVYFIIYMYNSIQSKSLSNNLRNLLEKRSHQVFSFTRTLIWIECESYVNII